MLPQQHFQGTRLRVPNSFSLYQIFNREWHKIHFSVTRDNVEMYIDCKPIAAQPLPPRRQVDVNGDIRLAARESDGATVPVILDEGLLSLDISCYGTA